MKAKLVAIAGPEEGRQCALNESETGIGRDVSNRLCLADLSVSRHHCAVVKDQSGFRLIDRGSLNSTFVNGIPVREHALRSGDRVRVGDTLLLFLRDDGGGGAELSAPRLVTRNTVQLRKEDDDIFQTSERPALTPASSRSTRDLNTLLKLSLTLASTRRLDALGAHLLPLVFEVIPAARGALALREDETEELGLVYSRHRLSGRESSIEIGRDVSDRVLGEGIALLSNGLTPGTGAISPEIEVRAMLAVPLTVSQRTTGLLYLDSPDPGAPFDEDHLQLARAIAAMTAVTVENLRQVDRLAAENRRLHAEISIEHDMVGQSPRMREVYEFIRKVARTDATVLICGESGTGKELAARAIHQNSRRSAGPFLAINCATLSEGLLESELFGHEKGAFTGAVAQKKGKLEVADGGTVFLDEIGEMALALQSKLLRVIQEREFTRVGGTRSIRTDVRLIAATNRQLEQAIRDGRFREDLYYRLNVLRLNLPPLRDRREDIIALGQYFVAKYAQRCHRRVRAISPEAEACLLSYHWPGNVREFENTIERAVVLGTTDLIRVEDLPESIIMTGPSLGAAVEGALPNFYDSVKEAKKRFIRQAFHQAQGSYTEAARLLGIHPNHLHRLIRNLDLKSELKKQETR